MPVNYPALKGGACKYPQRDSEAPRHRVLQ